ncbi:filamin/ABP280 repeat domain-containing protein, partial [Salmonella sp. s51228]|uniref:filamin/ABP280 repeat domain-containing protein n=1 Tax=Salmonella sp. s51228 TaxID=3159652 RepID=UPI00398186F3
DKVRITGDGLKGGNTNEPLKFYVIPEIGAGPGPLSVKISGPSKPNIVAEEAADSSITVTYTCYDPGDYEIFLRWGQEDILGCPLTSKVAGEA